ncbi:hypothetical protein MEX01_29010 [Methylorubrum extorquens]|uniref:hypothetical protein n=1 Tax=Methylorubrum extorquens TaxID=408 RepID=UPI001169E8B1|nr:hypothetical protein [Methylorubrum extorquens]GEL42310.1 hypothetical protein MEX01_29010 [Methylorubrum extorquens]
MAEATKSLAAEIEAVLRKFAHVGPDGQIMGLHEASKVLAALQGCAFEDGARKGLSDALASYDGAVRERETAEAVYGEVCASAGEAPDIGWIMDRIGAEGACMRSSMAEKIAQSKLIDAVRAALPLQPEGESDA